MSENIDEYWSSSDGILIRLEDLSHDFTFKMFNGATKAYLKDAGVTKLMWVTSQDNIIRNVSCPICEGRNGRVYKQSQFLPRIPVHHNCDCFWDVALEL